MPFMLVGTNHQQIVVVVTAGSGNQLCIRRGPELEVISVELQTGRAIVSERPKAPKISFSIPSVTQDKEGS